ncbi:MAG: hypothetical protein IKY34_02175 [Ruminiclostridium sp.]|nr:hypothetical protein [Ruminiclostridium sp.]
MKQKGKLAAAFAAGIVATLMVSMLVIPGFAATVANTITVHTGISIQVDGEEFTPTDVNGNEVEPLLYKGTTYLPVRAVSGLFGTPIDWDQETAAVLLGAQPGQEMPLNLFPMTASENMVMLTGEAAKFTNAAGEERTPFNRLDGSELWCGAHYQLDGKYTTLKGIFESYPFGDNMDSRFELYVGGFTFEGEEIQLFNEIVHLGDPAMEIELDVSGLAGVAIWGYGLDDNGNGAFYDITLTAAE